MRYLVLLCLLCIPCPGAQSVPAGVDALSPEDVSKAIAALKASYKRPEALSDAELSRATMQGLLDRLGPGVSLVTGTAQPEPAIPFYSEAYEGKTGYLRLGELTDENIARARQALTQWSGKGVGAVVLDLRGTPPARDIVGNGKLDMAMGLMALFWPAGTPMYTLTNEKGHPPGAGDPAATSTFAPAVPADLFKGILVVLVDGETAEMPELAAACLQKGAKALVVGDQTPAGPVFEYSDIPLQGAVLRVAVATLRLGNGTEAWENGVKPDIAARLGAANKGDLMKMVTTRGVASVTEEHDRPHLNEAALAAGSNPEVDELEAEESGRKLDPGLIDRQLQGALDLVTSISIYQAKADSGPKTGE